MDFSLFSFNTLLGNGIKDLKLIFEKNKPDIICLQEMDTSEKSLLEITTLGYDLADYSNSFIKNSSIYGVATYYNSSQFKFISSQVISLPSGFFDYLVYVLKIFKSGKKTRTVLKTEFKHIKTNSHLYIVNIHLTPWATNNTRLKHLKKTLDEIGSNNKSPIIVSGDFNYPYGRKKLEECMSLYRFKEATNTILSTVFKLQTVTLIERFISLFQNFLYRNGAKLDYMFYKNCSVVSSKTLHAKHSDHLPIISYFKFI
jgi:endonuclease/exonuclease/phosphatase family metal-dependent hydrolase